MSDAITINEPTFIRATEHLTPGERVRLLRQFKECKTDAERADCYRRVKGGSVVAAPSTKIATIKHTR
jgi:hypothetical protein